MDNDWVYRYLGKPWMPGAKGPDAFSCWGLVQAVYLERFGIDLPDFAPADWQNLRDFAKVFSEEQESRDNWIEVKTLRPLDVILLGRSSFPVHCGLWVTPDRVLHSLQPFTVAGSGGGVVLQPVKSFGAHGWGYTRFLRNKKLAEVENATAR